MLKFLHVDADDADDRPMTIPRRILKTVDLKIREFKVG